MHRIEIPQWAVERGRLAQSFTALDAPRAALLAIDLQNAFTRPGEVFANPHACDIVPLVNRLAAALRAAGGRVVWTRQTVSDDGERALPAWHYDESSERVRQAKAALRAGAEGHALHAGCEVGAGDWIVDKYRYSPFARHGSDLDARLRTAGIDTLVIAGTLTNCCCESAARDAAQLGYKVFFAADATAAVTDEEHNAALLNLTLMFADVRPAAEIVALAGAA
ncbi:MAG: cysteine hydrolase family protein [Solimonas sp.]